MREGGRWWREGGKVLRGTGPGAWRRGVIWSRPPRFAASLSRGAAESEEAGGERREGGLDGCYRARERQRGRGRRRA
eukprot:3461810-Rhodomonas_salina.1